MENVMDFNHILNWKLKAGSHPFPDKNGGTCINEAALVAAGFAYKEIQDADEMPPCFSRTIVDWAMIVNDTLKDDDRQRLLPYIILLAGTSDDAKIETKRKMILGRTLKKGMEHLLKMSIASDESPEITEWRNHWFAVLNEEPLKDMRYLYGEMYHEICNLIVYDKHGDRRKMTEQDQTFQEETLEAVAQLGVDALDAMMSVGNKAEIVDLNLIKSRMDKAKVLA
jgi:hypothetical protein